MEREPFDGEGATGAGVGRRGGEQQQQRRVLSGARVGALGEWTTRTVTP